MQEKIEGIVLNVRKYNDKNCIVTLFTRSRGRLSFISPAGTGKAANARRARLQPLSVVSSDLTFKPGVELQRLGSVSLREVWSDIYFNPSKRATTIFLSEFLSRLLNTSMPEENLYDFLIDALRVFDRSQDGGIDFHIPLLVSLLSYTGILPDVSTYRKGKVFDFTTGTFQWPDDASPLSLSEEDSRFVRLVTKINFVNIQRLRLGSSNRRRILYGLLNFYSYHFPGLSTLKSPEILRELFE